MARGVVSLLLLLITIIILALIFILANPFSASKNEAISPQKIQETQDVIDNYQQKSIERQTIEVE